MYLKENFKEIPTPDILDGFKRLIIKADIQPANENPYDEHDHYSHKKSFHSFEDDMHNRILFHNYFPFFCTDNLDYSFIGDSEFS